MGKTLQQLPQCTSIRLPEPSELYSWRPAVSGQQNALQVELPTRQDIQMLSLTSFKKGKTGEANHIDSMIGCNSEAQMF